MRLATARRPLANALLALGVTLGAARPAVAYGPEIEALAKGIAAKMAKTKLRTVAVYDFTDLRGEVTELGRFLAEELSSALVDASVRNRAAGPRVIDRLRLGHILEEMELQASSLIPPEELRQVGRIAGADALVTGRITSFADTVRLTVKVTDSRSAQDLLADHADLPRTPSLSELETRSLTVVVNPGDCGDAEVHLEGAARRTVEIDRQEIALRGCARVAETVHCLLTVTAREKDGTFYLLGGTRLVLSDGAQVPARRMTVGASTATGERSQAGDRLVRDVPTAASVSFDGVPARFDSIRLLELALYGNDARFEDVAIETP